jgi:hypothetical protein
VGNLDAHGVPGDGDYVFPAGLATVHIDRDRDLGEYWDTQRLDHPSGASRMMAAWKGDCR